jgi:predicted 2-oxoglutarate/Fe(II)-dependent dioxygenase YbiX
MSKTPANAAASASQPDPRVVEADGVLMGSGEAPADPLAAAGLYAAAADAGSGQAAERLAVMAAIGVARAQDWSLALDRLGQAAELGWRPAQRQLAVLGDRKDLAGRTPSGSIWRKVRAEIDMGALLKAAPLKPVFPTPAVFVAEAIASRAMCKWIIERGRGRLKPAQVEHVATGQSQADPMRTAEAAHFRLNETDLVMTVIQERIGRAINLPLHAHEPPNLLHYKPGQEYRAHFDFINPGVPAFAENLAVLGQRVATLLVYLNDDFEGGETRFVKLDWSFKGKPGDGLLFFNVGQDRKPDGLTLHAGMPPSRGEKWLLSVWVRDRVQPIL